MLQADKKLSEDAANLSAPEQEKADNTELVLNHNTLILSEDLELAGAPVVGAWVIY